MSVRPPVCVQVLGKFSSRGESYNGVELIAVREGLRKIRVGCWWGSVLADSELRPEARSFLPLGGTFLTGVFFSPPSNAINVVLLWFQVFQGDFTKKTSGQKVQRDVQSSVTSIWMVTLQERVSVKGGWGFESRPPCS